LSLNSYARLIDVSARPSRLDAADLRDWNNLAQQAATLLKAAQPHSEITVRDLWTVAIEHPSSR
jgi:hypothetical protein